MENQIKLSSEELEKVQSLRNEARENVDKIGRMNIQHHFLTEEIRFVEEQLQSLYGETSDIKKREQELVNNIVSKYGEGQLDFNTGIYSQNQDEKPN